MERGAESILCEMVSDLSDVRAETVFEAVVKGDAYAAEVVNETAKFLGTGLANIINVLNPEIVVILGGVTRAGDQLFVPLRAEIRRRAFRVSEEAAHIVAGQLTGKAGVIGAVACFKKEMFGEV